MNERQVAVDVVTYDPLRRKGFMRIAALDGGGRVHFALGMLPEDFKRPIIVASRVLNYHRDLTESAFHDHMSEVRRLVVGACFRASVRDCPDGRLRFVTRTIVHVPKVSG